VDHQEIQTSTAYESTQGNNLLFTFLPGDKPVELMVLWPDNSYQVIKDFSLNKKAVITYDKSQNSKLPLMCLALVTTTSKDKKEFTYVAGKGNCFSTIQPFETPDFNYYNLLPHTLFAAYTGHSRCRRQ
jgi:hypothetical protein